MLKALSASLLLASVSIVFFAACEGPAGACEDLKRNSCNDGKKANCTWDEGKNTKEEAARLTAEHKFNEGKQCSDLGYKCLQGICKK